MTVNPVKIALVYHSGGGNTKALAEVISSQISYEIDVFPMVSFDVNILSEYTGLIIGSYTWGNGDLPARAASFYDEISTLEIGYLTTAVFGTGETNYRHFCGAVDRLAYLLQNKTQLAVTLKVEQMFQPSDLDRVEKFCSIFEEKLEKNK